MLRLKKTLERFYREYDFRARIKHDPIEFPHRFSDPEDIEISGLIAACFAYGKVDHFKPVIAKILEHGSKHPAEFFKNFSLKKDAGLVKGVSYRFNSERDILGFIYIIGQALRQRGTLKDLFYDFYREGHSDIRPALTGFTDYLLQTDVSPVYGRNTKSAGLIQLLPSPRKGSACKRLNLFLRWMVRGKDIDFGIWDRIKPSKLIIPLDTHITKISRCIGLTKRTSPDWKTAGEITESLREFDPHDPLKYDFALCHHGISGLCRGEKQGHVCMHCALNSRN